MNRQVLIPLSLLVVALALFGVLRLLLIRPAARPAAGRHPGPSAPPGPPLAGTDVPLPAVLEPRRAALERLLAPAARLVPGGAPVARLGGHPRLPAGFTWPASPKRPMSFLGELDLALLHRGAPDATPALPAEGRLLLFYDVEEMRWGYERDDGSFVRLVHLPRGGQGQPHPAPPGATVFKERILGAKAVRVLPSPEDLPGDLSFDDEAEDPFYDYLAALTPEPDHRVGGPPNWIQGNDRELAALAAAGTARGTPAQVEEARKRLPANAASEWKLLWQVDSDDDAGFMWGDAGRLYLLARDADLRAGRFDRAWLVLQCY